MRTEVFQIASGERVMVVSDVRIHATNEVVIDGLLLAKPGVTIEIIAPKLTVRGTVCAGSGVNGVDVLEPGGNGGNVILRVADIRVEEGAVIRSGAGGNGSFGASGGDGGDILLLPSSLVSGGGEGTMEAGAGGTGGEGVTGYSDAARNGGNGGSGGAVGVITTSTV
ncbi:MAG: hypothetical protein JNM94_17055 [Phycisphaerae bacterium]|nr:hypothetical protein [Phycisphaerae bacterium]